MTFYDHSDPHLALTSPRPKTQAERLLVYLALNPGASSLEVTLACGIVNVTGRVSDLRAAGNPVECKRRTDGRLGYWLVNPAQGTLGL